MSADHYHLVFVYGTLKAGGSNHRFMRGQIFVGDAQTLPGFQLIHLGSYPGMIASTNASDSVVGEVWRVTSACLAQLDELEGIDEGLYVRVKIPLLSPFAGQPVETYLYAQSVEGRPPIPHGLWTEPTAP